MKIEVNPKEPMQFRVRYNGKIVFDEVLQPGPHKVEAEHPKTCGVAQCFIVEGDDEMEIGRAEYGECQCAPGTHPVSEPEAAAGA